MSQPISEQPFSPSAQALQTLMQRADISSQRALAEKAQVSRWQVQKLRQGNVETMRLSILKQLALALKCSLTDLLTAFEQAQPLPSPQPGETEPSHQVAQLRHEYTRLQQRLEQQTQTLRLQFQTEALQTLESWLTYWPTAAKAATERDGFDAKKLLPLVKPVERLVEDWGVTPMGTVGERLAYDPQQHQLVRGVAQPGDPVRISHVGYHHGDKLLQRPKVVPINP